MVQRNYYIAWPKVARERIKIRHMQSKIKAIKVHHMQ